MSKGRREPVPTCSEQSMGHGYLNKSSVKKKTAVIGSLMFVAVMMVLVWFMWPKSDLSWARQVIDDSTIFSMSKSEIDARLGQPDNPKGFFSGWDYVYHLEPDSLGIDDWWLIVNVDDAGEVVMASVVTD